MKLKIKKNFLFLVFHSKVQLTLKNFFKKLNYVIIRIVDLNVIWIGTSIKTDVRHDQRIVGSRLLGSKRQYGLSEGSRNGFQCGHQQELFLLLSQLRVG